jgi:mannose-6-phosphate isomerase-like protein (cupin superfamily)
MKKNVSTKFFERFRKSGISILIPMSAFLLIWILSSITVNAQPGGVQQEEPERIPLTERIGHTDPERAFASQNVHQGTGTLHIQTLLGRGTVFGLNFMHHGPLMPKSSIGHHFHTNSDEMFLILDGDCEFTINGQTALLEGPAGVPLKSGSAHAVYNPNDEPVDWVNFQVAVTEPGQERASGGRAGGFPRRGAFNYSADPTALWETGDDRSDVEVLDKPTFINTGKLTEETMRPVENMNGGIGTVKYRRTLGPGAFASNWSFFDHYLIPVGSTIGRHYHEGVDEVYFVIKGKGKVHVNDEVADIAYGDAVPVIAGEIHSFESSADEPLEMVVYGIALEKGKLDVTDVPLKMVKLQMFFEVAEEDFDAFEANYIDVYVPALRKQEGYMGSKLLRTFSPDILRRAGSPETKYTFQMELLFDTEEHRINWTKTPEHDDAWAKTSALAKSFEWLGYDVVGMDQVIDQLGERNFTTEMK